MKSNDIDYVKLQSNISDVHVGQEDYIKQHTQMYRLELDSHENMPVSDKGAHVEYTGRTVDENSFSTTYDMAPLPMVDAIIQYHCSHSSQSYLLIIINSLYVPEMNHHLIPPF